MTRQLSLLRSFLAVLVVMTVAATGTAETITLVLPEVEASAKGKVEVVVKVEGAKNLAAIQFVVVHDPAVLKVAAEADSGRLIEQAEGMLSDNFDNAGTESGRLSLAVISKPGKEIASDGELLKITYEVVGEAGKKSPLTIEKAAAWKSDETQILVETKDGSVTIGEAKTDAPPAEAKAAEFPWLWVIVAGLIAVIAALCVVLLRRKSDHRSASPRHARPSHDEEELVAVPESEPIRHHCDGCQRVIKVPSNMLGKKFKCPKCGKLQVVASSRSLPT